MPEYDEANQAQIDRKIANDKAARAEKHGTPAPEPTPASEPERLADPDE